MTQPTGVYIHWPYCEKICPYCDFNVARNRDVDADQWRTVFNEDISRWRERVGSRQVQSVYFGGGTPSLMPVGLVADVLGMLSDSFDFDTDIEITMEANPTDAEQSRFEAWRAVGVNRLSLGIQSFDDEQLAFLGRNHSADEARAALALARQVFGRVTFDLMFGLPDETIPSWEGRLNEAVTFGAQHLSVYQLTIEPGTAFANAVRRGDWTPLSDDVLTDFYEVTEQTLRHANYERYEISSYAQPGAYARHNMLYWTGADWLGVGPGAAGRVTLEGARVETMGVRSIPKFLSLPFDHRYAIDKLSDEANWIELLAGGLRLAEGVELAKFPSAVSAGILAQARTLDPAWLKLSPDRIKLTREGRMMTDWIASALADSF